MFSFLLRSSCSLAPPSAPPRCSSSNNGGSGAGDDAGNPPGNDAAPGADANAGTDANAGEDAAHPVSEDGGTDSALPPLNDAASSETGPSDAADAGVHAGCNGVELTVVDELNWCGITVGTGTTFHSGSQTTCVAANSTTNLTATATPASRRACGSVAGGSTAATPAPRPLHLRAVTP